MKPARILRPLLLIAMICLSAQSRLVASGTGSDSAKGVPQASSTINSAARVGIGNEVSSDDSLAPGTFGSVSFYQTGGNGALSVAVGDFNNDGKLDLVVVNQCGEGDCSLVHQGSVGILIGNGDGTFQTPITYGSGGTEPTGVAVIDVNGDGKLDVVLVNTCGNVEPGFCSSVGTIGVLLGKGDGTFEPATVFNSGAYSPISVAASDLNGDGKPDLIVTNLCNAPADCGASSTGAVSVLLGNGDGTFQQANIYSSGGYEARSIAAADVNNDGKVDLLVTTYCQSGCSVPVSLVGVLLGNGDGTFRDAALYNPNSYDAQSLAVGDVNGDGKFDVVVSDSQGNVSVLLGNGNGTFKAPVVYATGGLDSDAVVIGDVNGDKKPDLIAINQCLNAQDCSNQASGGVSVFLGNGDGSFQPAISYNSGQPLDGVLADVNGDGKPDVLVSNSSNPNAVGVLLNGLNGATPLVAPLSLGFGIQTTSTNSLPKVVTLKNTGDVALAVSSIVTTGDFVQSNSCGPTVAARSSCSISVAFSPTALGKRSGSLTINDNASPNSQSVVLSGSGVPPIGTIIPNPVSFPSQLVGTTSAAQELVFYAGSSPLKISSVVVSGDFAISTNNCVNGLNAGSHCSLFVTFTPSLSGLRSGTLTFTDTAPNSPQTAALMGTGGTTVTTTTALSSSPVISEYNQPVTLSATVTPESPGSPTGTVTFYNNNVSIGISPLLNSKAALTTSSLSLGGNALTADYRGDTNFQPSVSSALYHTVRQAYTHVSVVSTPNPSYFGQATSLTATVDGTFGGQPTGKVTFYGDFERHVLLGSATLVNGQATISTAAFPRSGQFYVSAGYAGDSNYLSCGPYNCDSMLQMVTAATSSTELTSSPNPSSSKQNVAFVAKVITNDGKVPSGSVSFKNGTATLATVKLVQGVATLSTSKLPVGNNSITAVYRGQVGEITPSTSAVLTQVVH